MIPELNLRKVRLGGYAWPIAIPSRHRGEP